MTITDLVDLDWSSVERGAAQLAATGACEIPGFVRTEALPAFVEDARRLAPLAHRSAGAGTVYLDLPDETSPPGHPRRWLAPYSVGAVAYDLFPADSPIRMLYEWDDLTRFVAAILGLPAVYRYADPLGALNLAVMTDGDELQWHCDQTDFVVSGRVIVLVGEGFAGEGAHVARVNVVVGERGGPVGTASASAHASPSPGHTPFVVVLQPNLPVRPFTPLVNKATIDGDRHATLTWGAAQAGVASGVRDALRDGVVDPDALVIAGVWVDPDAVDERAVHEQHEHNHAATFAALRAAREDRPRPEDVLAAGEPRNPYFPA